MTLFVGCGAGHGRPTTTQAQFNLHPSGHVYAVDVFFCTKVLCATAATRGDEQRAGAALRREPCVRRVVFVSKAEALVELKKRLGTKAPFPPGMGNPLPDSYTVAADKPSCLAAIAAAARAAHLPGVQQVALARRH